jgi:hypothetical protein
VVVVVAGKRKRRSSGEKRIDDFLSSVSFVATVCGTTEHVKIPPDVPGDQRQAVIDELKEASLALSALRQRIEEPDRAAAGENGVGKEPWRDALLRAYRGDMSALANRIESREATDVELWLVAHILLHPDDLPKHSFENMIDADRNREIANFVDFIARLDGDKITNVVEQWATKEYGLGRSAIWERIKRGRLLLPQKVKAEDTIYLGRLEPDGNGDWKRIPPSPAKTRK